MCICGHTVSLHYRMLNGAHKYGIRFVSFYFCSSGVQRFVAFDGFGIGLLGCNLKCARCHYSFYRWFCVNDKVIQAIRSNGNHLDEMHRSAKWTPFKWFLIGFLRGFFRYSFYLYLTDSRAMDSLLSWCLWVQLKSNKKRSKYIKQQQREQKKEIHRHQSITKMAVQMLLGTSDRCEDLFFFFDLDFAAKFFFSSLQCIMIKTSFTTHS